ncbi:MAG: purine/pyrimidine permease [Deltaproteobacteria bacterium]|nr:purine/pyrimidine permease [Deltaproteobacteria bacterium]
MENGHEQINLAYSLDERLPLGLAVLHGLQWLLVFLPILTIVSAIAADFLELGPEAKSAFFQRTLLLCGVMTTIQTLLGHRLPLTDGPAAALLLCLATVAPAGMEAISGGMIVGGLLLLLCGSLRLMRYLIPLFTDRVIGVILLLIALTILPFLLPMLIGVDATHPQGRPLVFSLSLILIAIMAVMTNRLAGRLKTLSLFLGVGLGTVLFAAFGLLDLSEVDSVPWVVIPNPAWGPWPRLNLSAIITFSLAYLAVLVNTMGSVTSLSPIVGARHVDSRLDRGLALTGVGGVLAGLGGVVGTVPYSNSPGVVTVTRVGTRFALTATGIILILLAFFNKVTFLLTAIPDAVVASALLTAMAAQIGVGMNIIQNTGNPMTGRDFMVVGIPILMGVMGGLLPLAFLNQVPNILKPIINNGLIVGLLLVLLLEHVLLKKETT